MYTYRVYSGNVAYQYNSDEGIFYSPGYTFNDVGAYTVTPSFKNANANQGFSDTDILTGVLLVQGDAGMSVTHNNTIYVGENATVKVTLNDAARGNITITVGDKNKTFVLSDTLHGTVEWNVTDLPEGTYKVIVNYTGDSVYAAQNYEGTLVVKNYDTILLITPEHGTYRQVVNATATLYYAKGSTIVGMIDDNLTVIINNKQYNVRSGEKIQVTDDLAVNAYEVVGIYNGGDRYKAAYNNTNLYVTKATPIVEIEVLTEPSEDRLGVRVRVNDTATGFVALKINDEVIDILSLKSVDEYGYLTKFIENINAGNFNIEAEYLEDENYTNASNKTSFSNIRGTYTDLQRLIDANTNLDLTYDFIYTPAIDGDKFPNGVNITKTITINGNNHTISGNNTLAVFYVNGTGVHLDNITFINAKAESTVFWNNTLGYISNSTFKDNNVTYDIYHNQTMYFENNTLENFIYNAGEILSKTNIIVLNNQTITRTKDVNVNLNAIIKDDNNNTIISKTKLQFILPDSVKIDATGYDEDGVWHAEHTFDQVGTHEISAFCRYIENTNIYKGAVIVIDSSDIYVTVPSQIEYGENATVRIVLDRTARGNITISVNGTPYTKIVLDDAFEGIIEYNLTNLPVNYYNVSVNYTGDDINPARQINNPLTVVKTDDYAIVVDVTLGKAGKNSTIKVTVPSDADGNITIVVDGNPHIVPGEEGVGILTIPLNAGDHVVNATLSNDTNYENKTSDPVPFNIPKDEDYSIGIKVLPGSPNSNTVIVVSVPNDADGNLTIVVDNVPHLVPIDENGVGILSIPLDAGDHVANATLSNDTNYANKTSDNAPFNIPDGETYSIGVTVLPGKAGEDSIIVVSVPSNADGNLTIVVNDTPYVVPVDEGIGILPVALDAGDHVVNATLSNDTSYPEKTSDPVSFNIAKVDDYTIGLDVVAGKVGEKTNITVTVPKGVTGSVVVDINGTVYPVTIDSEGKGVINVSDLAAGNYDAVAKVRNDPNYVDKDSEVKSFEIEDEEYSITVSVLPGEAGEDTIIAVRVPADADGNLTVVVDGVPYVVPVDEGIGILPVALDAGDHVVNATLSNDTSYPEKTSDPVSFNIAKVDDYTIGLDVVAGKVGEKTNITVTVPKGVTGSVVVDINGTVYPVTIDSEGKGVISVSTLPVGNYNAVAKVRNDPNYVDKDSEVKPFEIVGENPCPISMVVIPGSGDDPTDIIVVVPSDVDGKVTVNVDGVDYPVTIDDGVGILEIPLAPGDHVASAKVSDDSKYDDSQAGPQSFKVSKEDDYTIGLDVVAGKVGENTVLTVTVPKDVTGSVIIDINGTSYPVDINSNGVGVLKVSLAPGNYSAVAKVRNDVKYVNKDSNVKPFEILPIADYDIKVDVAPGLAGENTTISVNVPKDVDGNVTANVDGVDYPVAIDKDGNGVINLPLDAGEHTVKVTLANDTKYADKSVDTTFTVKAKTSSINATDMKRGYNSPYDYKATFTDANGNILKNTVVRFVVNGVSYYNATDENGVAYLSVALPVENYETTNYTVEIYNLVTGESTTAITSIVPRIIGVYNITDDYLGGISYIAQAIGDDGEHVGAGEVIPVVFAFKTYYMVTNETGHFVRTIGLEPGYYAIYSTYKGYKSQQTFVSVKQILTTKKITVKKSAKSFKLYATLKWSNGTALVGKTVTFTFRGKTYAAVTNSKGVATYTIKSSVINELKAGTTYKYKAQYVNDLTKGKYVGEVKVKK